MVRTPFEILFDNKIENDLIFPYWMYQIEAVHVVNRTFIKIYLFDKEKNKGHLDDALFRIGEKEFRIDTFNVVSDYNDPQIVGCAVELESWNENDEVQIIKETIDTVPITASENTVVYKKASFPDQNQFIIESIPEYYRNHVCFPQINDKFWQCSCGRIHTDFSAACACGISLDSARKIIEFDAQKERLDSYLRKRVTYDYGSSFEDCIKRYSEGLLQYGISAEQVKDKLNLEAERLRYNEVIRIKELQIKAEKKKKRTRLAIISIALFLIVGSVVGVKYIYPAIRYSNAEKFLANNDYDKAIEEFTELGAYKDSVNRKHEAKYKKAATLVENEDYDGAMKIYTELGNIPYSDSKTKLNDVRLLKAQKSYDSGDYQTVYKDLEEYSLLNDKYKALWNKAAYNYAVELKSNQEYEKAIDVFNKILTFEDSRDLKDESYYEYAVLLYNKGDYEGATVQFGKMRSKDTADPIYQESYYQYGLNLLNKGNLQLAVDMLSKAGNYNDAPAQVNEAKYKYVSSHKSNTDKNTYSYLKDLKTAGYKDSYAIFNNIYQWSITKIVANTSESDKTTDKSSISKLNTAYFHCSLQGGEPGAAATVSASSSYSTGQYNSKQFEGTFRSGDELYYYIWWEKPSAAPSSTVTVTFYVNGAAVGSKTISRP